MTTVLLADDHAAVRAGLGGMINAEHDLTVVREAGSGAEAMALAEAMRPDAILMDLQMPEVDGVTATEQIRRALPLCAQCQPWSDVHPTMDILRNVQGTIFTRLRQQRPSPGAWERVLISEARRGRPESRSEFCSGGSRWSCDLGGVGNLSQSGYEVS